MRNHPVTRCKLLFFIITLSVTFSVITHASVLVNQIDALVKSATKTGEPGVALLVRKNGKVLIRKGYGMADLELGVRMEPDMVFRIGSMTKQFTSVAILMLMEQGKLSIDDEITKFLPDYPTQGKRITVEHLLTHTSGIRSYTDMPEWLPLWRKDMSLEELIGIFKDQPMVFEPGEKWAYNNSGYILIGAIIEKISGETYASFIQKHIFEPLGMTHSFYGDTARVISRRIPGYAKAQQGYTNAAYLSMTQPYAAGSLLSTVDDLALWDAALYTEKLVKKSSLEKAWTPYTIKDGTGTWYGYGWTIGELDGHKIITHGGGINGFLTDGIRLPDDGIYVVLLSNNEGIHPDRLALKIAALCIGKPIADAVAMTLPAGSLDQFTGVYQIDDKNERIITRDGSKLFTQRTGDEKHELIPSSETEFFIREPETRFRFLKNQEGAVTAMQKVEVVHYGPIEIAKKTNKPIPKERQAIALDPTLLDPYVGDYELAPGILISIRRETSHLTAQMSGQEKLEIFPESETRFFLKDVDAQMEFQKDPSGKVTSLILYQGGDKMEAKRK